MVNKNHDGKIELKVLWNIRHAYFVCPVECLNSTPRKAMLIRNLVKIGGLTETLETVIFLYSSKYMINSSILDMNRYKYKRLTGSRVYLCKCNVDVNINSVRVHSLSQKYLCSWVHKSYDHDVPGLSGAWNHFTSMHRVLTLWPSSVIRLICSSLNVMYLHRMFRSMCMFPSVAQKYSFLYPFSTLASSL